MTTLFISDLHLHASRPEATQAFFQFLAEQATGIDALYILGDFFDTWIGDDDDAPLGTEVTAKLKEVGDSGTEVYLMHGNRDFLLGQKFARSAGAKLLEDPTVIELYGTRTLLMHGDSLCTRDTEYMAMRQQLRSAAWQGQVLTQPLSARRALADGLRAKSKTMNSSKPEDIMDVTQEAVEECMRDHKVVRLVHGHTHRPDRHKLTVNGEPAERVVLGDWHDFAWCFKATPDALSLEKWEI
ncbi:UDP-2,3-diacylglucosamine diphosphatase [Gilvimarinus sp. SDUM040013]|uniref:UDP-2,3-diacylglucosamine hydrolase n=1 Tax=Gilvimarinus gilvus TaxID=3058038 RepID=A0ABU4RWB2_9GAMM|nr:UDP-2,3-diacylglucosamine diphosphatase [Gilvimarinus sp. SDUM040013]MDO3386587.1 UDP-2,3-diacylglucosamine diphosphatase [Gilvimarinus sp. SDUM040013]MDX6849163.1 UDP-2,3-diacylglucosamine diphosphatase [Gilvimarinus sp. SDUM040013]